MVVAYILFIHQVYWPEYTDLLIPGIVSVEYTCDTTPRTYEHVIFIVVLARYMD